MTKEKIKEKIIRTLITFNNNTISRLNSYTIIKLVKYYMVMVKQSGTIFIKTGKKAVGTKPPQFPYSESHFLSEEKAAKQNGMFSRYQVNRLKG